MQGVRFNFTICRCVQVYSLVQQRKNQSCQSKNKSCLISSALDKKYSELLTYEHDGQRVNSDHSESTDKQLPKTSASQNNGHVVISGLILTSLLGLLTLLKRKNNNESNK
ncbi:MAG: LPXTG cell wall anchor domain-containing protein [Leuconostoc mesenteroides]